jgi:choline dehydrogenase-like flavoprotein
VAEPFDVVVVGAGSAGAVLAARLSEDPAVRVALLEAGGPPPPEELLPAAVASLQNDPRTDWMYTGDAGGAGRGLRDGRMMVPRGKMLGGSSGINYLAYVRGHPGDFDAWADGGATGWSYDEVLPYFKKSEGLQPSGDIVVDHDAHNPDGPMGVSVRSPVIPAAQQFVDAARAIGIPTGDYNGADRLRPEGVASLFQTTTRNGRRTSTFHAFLEPVMTTRDNLVVLLHAHVQRLLLEDSADGLVATGVEYRTADGTLETVMATREVVLCAGAIGSPQLLLLSGVGPRDELAEVGVECRLDLPEVGKHLKDHLETPLVFPAPGIGLAMADVAVSLGPDALREPVGPLPADPADDADLPPELAGLKAEAERRLQEWVDTGRSLVSSTLYDAALWYSTGLGDEHTHDAQISFLVCGYTADLWRDLFRVDPSDFFDDPAEQLSPLAQLVLVLPNPVQPRSEGEVRLASADPDEAPRISLGYFTDPHDVQVMVAVMRRALDLVAHWPVQGMGELLVPPRLAELHGHAAGDRPSDALLEDLARHYALTVYHETSTCRIGSVVDPDLRVLGVGRLRVADASVMPNVPSGNTNAAAVMIGEKAAELIARAHGMHLASTVGPVDG